MVLGKIGLEQCFYGKFSGSSMQEMSEIPEALLGQGDDAQPLPPDFVSRMTKVSKTA